MQYFGYLAIDEIYFSGLFKVEYFDNENLKG